MPNPTTFGRRYTKPVQPAQIMRAATAPRTQDAECAAGKQTVWPLLTTGLILLLAAIFYVQQLYGGETSTGFALGGSTLAAEGGVSRYLAFHEHEWWRIFTAPFLHGSLAHLIANAVTLGIAGALLEKLVGRGWLAALYAVGAAGGSFGSLAYSDMVSVGASGAIMCLVTVLFVLSFHYETARYAKRLRRFALFLLIPALSPSAAHNGTIIDIGAHFGGVMAGMTMGFLLLGVWPEETARPAYRGGAAVAGALGLLASAVAFVPTVAHYSAYVAKGRELIAQRDFPQSYSQALQNSEELVRRYPHDPRAGLFRALYLLKKGDAANAESHLRDALKYTDALTSAAPDLIREQLQTTLALSLVIQGRVESARAEARSICGRSADDPLIAKLLPVLSQHGVCD